uniref:Uncharacterized protein n=1 Tax=Romanomermis culicivorax TaxID=13658 RepID=A0A915IZG6_ROMCU
MPRSHSGTSTQATGSGMLGISSSKPLPQTQRHVTTNFSPHTFARKSIADETAFTFATVTTGRIDTIGVGIARLILVRRFCTFVDIFAIFRIDFTKIARQTDANLESGVGGSFLPSKARGHMRTLARWCPTLDETGKFKIILIDILVELKVDLIYEENPGLQVQVTLQMRRQSYVQSACGLQGLLSQNGSTLTGTVSTALGPTISGHLTEGQINGGGISVTPGGGRHTNEPTVFSQV